MAKSPILPRIQALDAYVPGLSIEEIRSKYGLDEVIKLASNENPLGAPPLAQEAVKRQASSIFRYPRGGNPRLRQALAEWHGVSPDRIATGNGSDEVIDLLIRMTAHGGDHNIVCFRPCFSIYPIQAAINGVEARRVPLENDFSFNFKSLLEQTDTDTRLVFVTTPDNPSGYCPQLDDVRQLAESLASKAPLAYLVIDEAYMDFARDEKKSSMLACHELPENVVFLRTFSKSFGLAGLRVGYAVMPECLADAFWRSRLPFSVNILAEDAALAALADKAFRQETLQTVAIGRDYLNCELLSLGCKVWPSEANFLMFQIPGNSLSARECCEKLLQQGIIVRSLASYDLSENIRVSVGNKHENKQFIAAMRRILAK